MGKAFNNLFCLKDYADYALDTLEISFETCDSNKFGSYCMSEEEIEKAMAGKEFWFPIEQAKISHNRENMSYRTKLSYEMQLDLIKYRYLRTKRPA